jgi:hypothetical protein
MKITIKYEASWRNSFLDGDNNSQLPKKGRKYIASITNLKNEKNFIQRKITINTVMGILNRLIGDQRKLYQSKQDKNYYFIDIENKVTYNDSPKENQEMIYLRNISSGIQFDQKSFTGSIIINDPIFTSNYSNEFWGVLTLSFEDLCEFIVNDIPINSDTKFNPITVTHFFESLKLKPVENNGLTNQAIQFLWDFFKEEVNYFNNKGEVIPLNIYCSALYLQLERLSKKYDVSSARTPSGGIKGISKRLFTKKDFMDKYVTGGKKIIFGNPYIQETFIKGQGKTKNLMTKANGELDISIAIDKEKAKELRTMIENAGVSSFYLGKKGLAYIDSIEI